MRITSLQRWHWILIALIVGAACGALREASLDFSDELASYNARRIGQREFEHALVDKVRGQARFTQITIYPYRLDRSVSVHVVYGLYWDGQTHLENGQLAAHWLPAYFVASLPYHPIKPQAQQFPTVMAYLDSLASGGVQFHYASWFWATRPLALWTLCSFLLIGIVWPTIINLLAFGTFRRPPTEKAPSLRHVKSTPAAPAAPTPPLLENLELDLSLDDSPPPPPAPAPSPIRPLSEAAPDPVPTLPATPSKEFGADKEDFYPTERRAKQEQ